MPDSLDEQLNKYLTDVHSIEEQALQQLRAAPKLAGYPELARIYSEHEAETEGQESRIRERLEARGASPSKLKDVVARAGGFGMVLFARFNPDTPGKLAAHSYSYEHMELAAYDLLGIAAQRAGDHETADVAATNGEQEAAMADRLAAGFDLAVDASLRELEPGDLGEQLVKYLADAHAIEAQSIQLLEKGPAIAGQSNLALVLRDHLEESQAQQRLIEARLDAHGATANKLQDAALRIGAVNWGAFFAAQPDTPAKLAGFAFAVEHLEIAAYELLQRVAIRAGDDETARIAERIIGEEHSAAARIRAQFENAMDAALERQGVA